MNATDLVIHRCRWVLLGDTSRHGLLARRYGQVVVKYRGTVWPWHASWLTPVFANVTVAVPALVPFTGIAPKVGAVVIVAV
jgi:hypothetical protein